MTNPIQKAHLKGIKLFDEKFASLYFGDGTPAGGGKSAWKGWKENVSYEDVKSFLTTYAEMILNAALEAGPGEKECTTLSKGEYCAWCSGHGNCRQALYSAINEGIKEIKKGDV